MLFGFNPFRPSLHRSYTHGKTLCDLSKTQAILFFYPQDYAMAFMDDLRDRLSNRVQLTTTDGHKAYLEAVEGAFMAAKFNGMCHPLIVS